MTRADARIPVVVITGFLGGGKTTLLQRMLANPAYAESLVIVNEIGAVGIDHHLLARSDDRTLLLENGCVCCALRGDLQETLVDIGMRRKRGELPGFDRVFIETSGLAAPGPIAQTLHGDASLVREYTLRRIVTLVDAAEASGRNAAPDIAARQVAAADVVVLSKVDRAAPGQVSAAEAWVRTINALAPCIPATHGDVDPEVLLSPSLPWRASTSSRAAFAEAPLHTSDITSFVVDLGPAVHRDTFDAFIATLVRLRGADLLRVKGVVRFVEERAPQVVQGVHHVFEPAHPLPRGAVPPAGSLLVFVTRALPANEVTALWHAMRAVTTVGATIV